jgi:hypothetical protein
MTDVPVIRSIRIGALFVMLIFFISSAQAASQPHKKGRFTAVFEPYSPLSDANSIMDRTRVRPKHGLDKKHQYDIAQESFEVY